MQSTTNSHFAKLIEAAAMVTSGSGNFLQEDSSVTFHVSTESANRTIFLADLPRNTSYLHLSSFFEDNIGPCVIYI